MPPLVSIIVPNYKHARFLPQRLDSILAQTFKDYELIVLDDASPDNSRDFIQSYAAKVPMRFFFNEKNTGCPFIQWQKGVALAVGKYLWIAESDDYADPRLLATLVAELQKNPQVGLAYCQSSSVDENGKFLRKLDYWTEVFETDRWSRSHVNNGKDEIARYLIVRNIIPNASGVVVRRDVFVEAVQGAEKFRRAGDWWTWARVLLQSDVAYVAEPLNFFRAHGCSVRDTTKHSVAALEDFSVMAHICLRVQIPIAMRRYALREAMYFWSKYFTWANFQPSPEFWREVCVHAQNMVPNAAFEIAWFRTKRSLLQINFFAATVRRIKNIFGSSNKLPVEKP